MNTFNRGQVEWAIWRYLADTPKESSELSSPFSTRLKRLLEIDREKRAGYAGFAFSDQKTAGRGSVVNFNPFDAFCLTLAMDMLDVGFKQSEIVFFISHAREAFRAEFKYIRQHPLPPRIPVAAEDAPLFPSRMDNGVLVADGRVYMVTRKVEMKEIFDGSPEGKHPVFIKPDFFRGVEALTDAFNLHTHFYRKSSVFELSGTANRLCELLDQAPEIRRGRP